MSLRVRVSPGRALRRRAGTASARQSLHGMLSRPVCLCHRVFKAVAPIWRGVLSNYSRGFRGYGFWVSVF